jgi:uncharacterized protein (TIGR00730 family)
LISGERGDDVALKVTAGGQLAYTDPEFLASDDGRPVRILAEYLGPAARLAARACARHHRVLRLGASDADGPDGAVLRSGRELARLLTVWSKSLSSPVHRYVICSGGGGGIMEAANRGASDAGGRTVGLNISLPHEQRPNPYVTRELSFEFHYFFMRKLWFAHLARALVVFPGGFGTLDELTEILTLAQTRKLDSPIPVILYGSAYWKEIINFDALVRHGMIAPEDLKLFEFADTPQAALAVLKTRLVSDGDAATPHIAHSASAQES